MANIFNVFGAIVEPNNNSGTPIKSLARSKKLLATEIKGKTTGLIKPKGLSIRSNSDLNIPTSSQFTNIKNHSANNPQQYLKPKLTQLDNTGCPISPGCKQSVTKKQAGKLTKMNEISSKKKSSFEKLVNSQKFLDNSVFKKPFTPKNDVKFQEFPEPENLAPYCDPQFENDRMYTTSLQNELKKLMIQTKCDIKPYEDEGFESEPEELPSPAIPDIAVSSAFSDEEYETLSVPDLPEISDEDDF